MERETVKKLFGRNFIGREELQPLIYRLKLTGDVVEQPIDKKFNDSQLQKAASEGYILIWYPQNIGGIDITLRYLRNEFGIDPEQSEPCFYNQDWYLQESFIDETFNANWYLIKKDVFRSLRALLPRSGLSLRKCRARKTRPARSHPLSHA